VQGTLDHNVLNEIPGLETPSLETICRWIAGQLSGTFPGLAWVKVARPSCHEYCTYRLI
jgi:6-pyruvoyltetrahydropterin/6-carboxytetrahydropterin synthase